MARVSQTDFLPKLIARVQERILQIENGEDDNFTERLLVDLMTILGMAQELDAYLNGEIQVEESLEPQEQALVMLTQCMEEARQEYLGLLAASEEDDVTWH